MLIPTVIFGAWNLTMQHKSEVQKFFIHTSNYAITPQLILSITLLTLNTFRKKNKNAMFMLIALLIVVATSLRDIYYVNNSITPFCWTVPYAFLLLCISILFILIMEQTATFNKAQVLAGEVFEKNSIQSSLIENIASLTKNINETGEIQNSAIAETIGILGKYENNNNTIINNIIKEIDELERSISSISDNIQKSGKRVVESINEQLSEVALINESIKELNTHINMINENATETNENAKKLINYADNSKTIINSSINYISEIQDYTKFIEDLLNSIEEITEKTGILSINASIEAANSGEKGKGFSVIAHEIRNLSVLTNKSLTSSFSHLKDMISVITKSKKQSEEVGNALQNIIENLNMTASKLSSITQLIGEQMKQTAGIVEFTSKVQKASKNIHEFAINNNEENEKSLALLFRIENIFNDIKEKLSGQTNEVKVISGAIQKLEQSMKSNLKYIEELNSKIKK